MACTVLAFGGFIAYSRLSQKDADVALVVFVSTLVVGLIGAGVREYASTSSPLVLFARIAGTLMVARASSLKLQRRHA